ncbi:hypothetical protein [Desulfococcus sp.]|uniref:hypothetical protein n=1 Tax=Desulfococcus sp. TaxID=2025834 RepID=UPI003593CB36
MPSQKEIDAGVPGGVYLCQVNDNVSCGACCGLYNVERADRHALAAMLEYRTRRFSGTPRTMDAILGFAEEIHGHEPALMPYPEFHHCPYIGMVGDKKARVGCLLHPLADGNGGVDFRGLSYYGGMACRTYFCPTCKSMNPVYKRVIRSVADDWHAYGLIVTEAVLVDSFFKELESLLGRALDAGDIVGHEGREALIRRFIGLRRDWPFRSRPEKLCNYFFEDRRYLKSPVDYGPAGGGESGQPHDALFRELESRFASEEALRAAERMFDELFDEWVTLVDASPHKGPRGG